MSALTKNKKKNIFAEIKCLRKTRDSVKEMFGELVARLSEKLIFHLTRHGDIEIKFTQSDSLSLFFRIEDHLKKEPILTGSWFAETNEYRMTSTKKDLTFEQVRALMGYIERQVNDAAAIINSN